MIDIIVLFIFVTAFCLYATFYILFLEKTRRKDNFMYVCMCFILVFTIITFSMNVYTDEYMKILLKNVDASFLIVICYWVVFTITFLIIGLYFLLKAFIIANLPVPLKIAIGIIGIGSFTGGIAGGVILTHSLLSPSVPSILSNIQIPDLQVTLTYNHQINVGDSDTITIKLTSKNGNTILSDLHATTRGSESDSLPLGKLFGPNKVPCVLIALTADEESFSISPSTPKPFPLDQADITQSWVITPRLLSVQTQPETFDQIPVDIEFAAGSSCGDKTTTISKGPYPLEPPQYVNISVFYPDANRTPNNNVWYSSYIPGILESLFATALVGFFVRFRKNLREKIKAHREKAKKTDAHDNQEWLEKPWPSDVVMPSTLIPRSWQKPRLKAVYLIVYVDSLTVNVLKNNKEFYLVLAINHKGQKELLGGWLPQSEDTKFWHSVLIDLQIRGMEDILIARVGGINGLPEAMKQFYPLARIQPSIVHLVKNSLHKVKSSDRKKVRADLEEIYSATTIENAKSKLEEFAGIWDARYHLIADPWRPHIDSLFDFQEDMRKVIYNTSAIDSARQIVGQVTRNHGDFSSDEAVYTETYPTIENLNKKWTKPIRDWVSVRQQFAAEFRERFPG